MILLVTNRRDLTMDFVILELQRRGLPYVRLNTELLPKAEVRLGFRDARDWSIDLGDRTIQGEGVRAAYFRRPGAPEIDETVLGAGERAYCTGEGSALLKGLYSRLGDRWLSTPAAIMMAEDKPRQLLEALTLGFQIPETVVTNAFGVTAGFLEGPPAIAKPLREALIEGDGEKIIFTSRVESVTHRDKRAIKAAPMILQREIPKHADVRVTVVGEKVFATTIQSQGREETTVDWRRGGVVELPHEPIELPRDVAERCVALVRALGLGFGAIDLVWDKDDAFWFLEINPNGQWAWIENLTGYPIASAIVDELDRIART